MRIISGLLARFKKSATPAPIILASVPLPRQVEEPPEVLEHRLRLATVRAEYKCLLENLESAKTAGLHETVAKLKIELARRNAELHKLKNSEKPDPIRVQREFVNICRERMTAEQFKDLLTASCDRVRLSMKDEGAVVVEHTKPEPVKKASAAPKSKSKPLAKEEPPMLTMKEAIEQAKQSEKLAKSNEQRKIEALLEQAKAKVDPKWAASCQGKQRHDNQAIADMIIKKTKGPHRLWLQSYRCKFCDGWHVGNSR